MNVLELFNSYLEKGGEESAVRDISSFVRDDHNVEQLWWSSEKWVSASAPSKLSQIVSMFYNQESAAQLRAAVAQSRPDVLLSHNLYPVASPGLYQVAQELEIPVVQYIHNFRPFSVSGNLWNGVCNDERSLAGNFFPEILRGAWQGSVVKSAIMAAVIKNAHWQGWFQSIRAWIAISDFMRSKFIEAGVDPDKIVTLRHSWDARAVENTQKEGDYYLFLSRLVPEKGVDCLLKAWKLLEKEMGVSCPSLKIGGIGPEEGLAKKAAEQSDKIDYVGFVSGKEKESLIAHCRAMLAPSVWWEPLGLVTYEAYDFSKPMIAAKSGGLSETVMPGQTGFLHAPDHAEELCEAVRQCERLGVSGRRALGQAGRTWLLEKACPEQWKKRFQSIITHYAS